MDQQEKILIELLDESGLTIHTLLIRLTLHREVADQLMVLLFTELAATRSLSSVTGLGAYAIRTAIDLACNWRRGKKIAVLPRSEIVPPAKDSDHPLDIIINHEQPGEILDAAARLKGNLRFAFVMRYIQSESYDRIGERMRRTAQHVRRICFKARTKVLVLLEAAEPEANERKLSRKLRIIAEIEPDFQTAEKSLQRSRHLLAEGLSGNAIKRTRSPHGFTAGAKAGAAIAVTVVIVILSYVFWPSAREPMIQPKSPDTQIVRDRVTAQETTKKETLKKTTRDRSEMLNRMAIMFAEKNIDALIGMLDQQEFSVRLMAANYLGRIGDQRAIDALRKLSGKWQRDNNPFALAIEQIDQRLEDARAGFRVDIPEPVENIGRLPPRQASKKLAKKITYSGIVTDTAGEPLEGVTVTSKLFYAVHPALIKRSESQTQTNAAGSFALTSLDWLNDKDIIREVIFQADNYASAWLQTSDQSDTENIRITLIEPTIFFGIVTDSSGKSIADAKVIANILSDPANNNHHLITKTGPNGTFSFSDIPTDSRIALDIFKPQYRLYSSRYLDRFFDVTASSPPVMITLYPGVAIHGQLISHGNPFAKEGLFIRPHGLGAWAITDSDGQFEIMGLNPETEITISLYTQNIVTGTGLICKPLTLRPPSDPDELIDLDLVDGQNVSVRFIDDLTAQPVKHTRFSITTTDGFAVMHAATDNNGQLNISLNPGRYELLSTDRNWEDGQYKDIYSQFVVPPGQKQTDVDIPINTRPAISGRLIDSRGNAVEGIFEFADYRQYSDTQGRFAFEEPADMPAEIICFAFDKERETARAFYWQTGQSAEDLQIELLPYATVTGTVIDPNGDPAPNAPVWYGIITASGQVDEDTVDQTKTDENGIFEIQSIIVGLPILIHADLTGERGAIEIQDLTPDETTNIGQIPGYQ